MQDIRRSTYRCIQISGSWEKSIRSTIVRDSGGGREAAAGGFCAGGASRIRRVKRSWDGHVLYQCAYTLCHGGLPWVCTVLLWARCNRLAAAIRPLFSPLPVPCAKKIA